MSKFVAVVEVIRWLIRAYEFLKGYFRRVKIEEQREKQEKLEKAVDDSKAAQTEEEFFDSQDRIVRSK